MGTYEPKQFAALLSMLALTACGGGGDGEGGGDNSPSFQVSGRVTSAAGAPVANVQIDVAVRKDCFGTTIPIPYDWFGAGTSNAAGEYVANLRLTRLSDCTLNFPFRMQATSFSCGANKQLPCYVGGVEVWQQSNLSPKAGVNFVVAEKARIFGTIQFPNGTKLSPSRLKAGNSPDTSGGQDGFVDDQGRFSFGPLEPGSYTVDFPPHRCSDLTTTGCNGTYDFTPPSISVNIVAPDDIDISFSAIPK